MDEVNVDSITFDEYNKIDPVDMINAIRKALDTLYIRPPFIEWPIYLEGKSNGFPIMSNPLQMIPNNYYYPITTLCDAEYFEVINLHLHCRNCGKIRTVLKRNKKDVNLKCKKCKSYFKNTRKEN